jgi:hypothetical protein
MSPKDKSEGYKQVETEWGKLCSNYFKKNAHKIRKADLVQARKALVLKVKSGDFAKYLV